MSAPIASSASRATTSGVHATSPKLASSSSRNQPVGWFHMSPGSPSAERRNQSRWPGSTNCRNSSLGISMWTSQSITRTPRLWPSLGVPRIAAVACGLVASSIDPGRGNLTAFLDVEQTLRYALPILAGSPSPA